MAYTHLGDQATLAATEKAKALAAAKAASPAKILAMRSKGAADAKAGNYAPPPPAPKPDFDTMNYQAGWKSTGIPLPSGVVEVKAPSAAGGSDDEAGSKTPLIIGGAVVAAVAAFIFFRR
jgi:hypothetical protein